MNCAVSEAETWRNPGPWQSFQLPHLESTMSDGPHEGWAVEHCQSETAPSASDADRRAKFYTRREHIKAMTEILDSLSVVGDPVPEEECVVHLLASLPGFL